MKPEEDPPVAEGFDDCKRRVDGLRVIALRKNDDLLEILVQESAVRKDGGRLRREDRHREHAAPPKPLR